MKSLVIAILACICFCLLLRNKERHNTFVWIVYFLIFTITISFFISKIIYRMFHPEVWDFTCFYLYGNVASNGQNFYLPENFQTAFNLFNFPDALNIPQADFSTFVTSCVDVGFPYPPPTILYFAFLGFLSYHTALILWTLFISIFAFISIYLAYSLFLKEYNIKGLILTAILCFLLDSSKSTVFYTQTGFILLFLLLLMKKFSDNKIAGVFLALAIFTKPLMLIFGLYFLFRKKWDAIIYGIGSGIVLVVITLLFFGKEVFKSYVFNNPAARLPASVFFEGINQSLHSVLLRHNLITLDNPEVYTFITIVILSLTGVLLLYLLKKKLYNNIWSVLLLIGLLIYPGTLGHYGVLLLFIIFQFFDKQNKLYFNPFINILLIGIIYLLMALSLFSTICFLLLVVLYKSMNPDFLNKANLACTAKKLMNEH